MKSVCKLFIAIGMLIFLGFCSPGDIIQVDKNVDRIFEIKMSGNYNTLDEMIHSEAKNDLRIEFFTSLFDRQKAFLGDHISHKRSSFNYKLSGGRKIFHVVYEVKYSNKDVFWERFSFMDDANKEFRLVGYAANEERELVEFKEEQ